jgi:uracil-DNA glycosylase family 4
MHKYIPPEGDENAEIIFIGEGPAERELKKGIPFQGSSGRYLNQFFNMAGIVREDSYLTNIMKTRMPANKIKNVNPEILEAAREDLIAEINALPNPKILVPLGDYPLQTVTDKRGITNFRGSVLPPKDSIKHDCIVIPTFHPSILHYSNYHLWPLIVADFSKVALIRDRDFEFSFPEYNFKIHPSFEEVMETLDWLDEQKHEIVVIDVETPHAMLSCIGLAWSRSEAISIPFFWGTGQNYWSIDHEYEIWRKLGEVLPRLNLAGQNVFFDWEIMYNHKILLKPAVWDSMLMHGCLYSELPHNLETIISIYTEMMFYKRDEDDETKRSSLRAGQEHDHWTYNCLDCVGTLWSIEELRKELEEEHMIDAYQSLYADMIPCYFEMNMRGVPVDIKRLPAVQESLKQDIIDKEKKIEEILGFSINVKSSPQVCSALYDHLGWDEILDRKTKNRTANKKAMEKLAYKYRSELPNLIQEAREDYSFISVFSIDNIEDGYFRTSYSLARTKTGRLSSRKSYSGKGRNLQNVKNGMPRTFFKALPGHVLMGGDQKQAEARFVAYFSQDEDYIKAAESGQLYMEVGKMVFDPEFTKEHSLYKVVKSLVHGTNYRMGPFGFAYAANIPVAEAKQHRDAFLNRFPGIIGSYYKYVEESVNNTRMLYNPFGRRQVFFKHIDESVYKAACAFIPQSTSSDLTKKAIARVRKYYTVLMDLHDGLYISVPPKEWKFGAEALQEAFDVPIPIFGKERRIPIDVSIGPSWGEMEEIEV